MSTAVRGRTRTILVICAVAVVALVLLLVIAPWRGGADDRAGGGASTTSPTDATSDPSPSTYSGTPAPATTAPPQDPPDIDDAVQAEVEDTTTELVAEIFELTVPIDPEEEVDLAAQLQGVVSDTYLSELEAERLEFEAEGWTRTGSYELGTIDILDYQEDGDGVTATVRVCVDSSGVTVTNADGNEVAGPSGTSAWNIFVLTQPADSEDWLIVGRTFPDDPAC